MAARQPALAPQHVPQVAGDAGLGCAPRLTGPGRKVASPQGIREMLALLGVKVVAAVTCALLVARACEAPGQRLALAA